MPGMMKVNAEGIPGNETSSSIREQLEIGDAVESLIVVLRHGVDKLVSQGQVKAACDLVGRWSVDVDAAPILLLHENFGVADKGGSDAPALETRVHREPVQLSKTIPLSKLDADEACEDAIRLGDVTPPTGSGPRISREDIEFVELARDVPALPPVSRQDLTDAFPVEPGFIRDDFDHALPNYIAPSMT